MKRSRLHARLVDAFFRSSLGLLICAIALVATVAQGAEVALPFANFGGYQTTLVVVNPTSTPAPIAANGPRWPSVYVAPGSVQRFPAWPGPGGSVASLEVPEGVVAYTEIRDPNNARVRIGDVGAPRSSARLLDLLVGDGFKSFVFIYSPTGGAIDVTQRSADVAATYQLSFVAGETKIVEASAETLELRADPTWARYVGEGKFVAFALLSRQPNGELLAAPAY